MALTLPIRSDRNKYICVSTPCDVCDRLFSDDLKAYEAQEARKAVEATTQAALNKARREQVEAEFRSRLASTAPPVTTFLGKPVDYWQRLDRLARSENPALVRRAEAPERLFLGGPENGKMRSTGDISVYYVPDVIRPSVTGNEVYRRATVHKYYLRKFTFAGAEAQPQTFYTYEGTE